MSSAQDRTEKPTARRRGEARKKGQVARSQDISAAAVLIAGLLTIAMTGAGITQALGNLMRAMLEVTAAPQRALSASGLHTLLEEALHTLLITVGPVAGACVVAAVLNNVAQAGGRLSFHAPKFDVKRISPAKGLKNLVSPNVVFEAVKSLVKVLIVAAVTALSLVPQIAGIAAKVGMEPLTLGSLSASMALGVAEHAAFAYLLVGFADYAWRRRQHERSLRMSKQAVRDEARSQELPGEIKGAIRRRQRQLANMRMMAAVPGADVVVANPTHFAVALLYDGSKSAPEVVAKGQDLIALQIRRLAEEHGVPVVTDPPLARALFSACELGQTVPAELYAAVARVLAFVYRVARRTAPVAAGAAR